MNQTPSDYLGRCENRKSLSDWRFPAQCRLQCFEPTP